MSSEILLPGSKKDAEVMRTLRGTASADVRKGRSIGGVYLPRYGIIYKIYKEIKRVSKSKAKDSFCRAEVGAEMQKGNEARDVVTHR